ncbi:hypothetical protein ACFC1R_30575 [Kitasatospora sp. NPDC056138]|uniref:hypothetical protein n=1 Tax=Kitasatospora sp. NPDC056138 TaxID=3345724 RepID=UPI0035DCD9DF
MPLYSALAAAWRLAGRTVPGQPDPLWEALTRRRRRASGFARRTADETTAKRQPDGSC